jgi:hypothetical protein
MPIKFHRLQAGAVQVRSLNEKLRIMDRASRGVGDLSPTAVLASANKITSVNWYRCW